jgi:xanthine dehydrogenase accessory factor
MESLDLTVLSDAMSWQVAGHAVTLFTVVETWGSAPRPPGSLLAIRDDGVVSGSVSGGCVEDDLIARSKAALNQSKAVRVSPPSMVAYGVSKEEATRFGLPCGGSLRLVQEPLHDTSWIDEVLQRTARHQLVAKTLTLSTGAVALSPGKRGQMMSFDGYTLTTIFGPRWRLLLIGAGQLSQAVAAMATALDFEVLVCDPREEHGLMLWEHSQTKVHRILGMPDDAVNVIQPDAHTAIVALTHDPKLDDMALLEALGSDAFYVGALGSRRNQETRKQRLSQHFAIPAKHLARLHGPVGLRIGARTPAEIAVSIIAEIVQEKNAAIAVSSSAMNETCSVA